MSFRTTGATNVWEGFSRNNATTGRKPPAPYPITVMWSVYIDSLVAAYASIMLMGPKDWEFGNNNWIASIGPFGGGGANAFAMSANGSDIDTGLPLTGNTGKWLRQCIRVWKDGSNAHHEYYPDLLGHPNVFGSIDVGLPYFSGLQANTIFMMGCPPWANQEGLNGKIGDIKIWRTLLSKAATRREAPYVYPVLSQYEPWIYGVYPARQNFKNLNSSAGGNDLLLDASGKGNHFFQTTAADNWADGDTGGCEPFGDAPLVWTRPPKRIFLGLVNAGSGSNVALQGAAVVAASASGALTHAVPLAGAATASVTASGSLQHGVPLQGAALSSAIANGALSLTVNLAGDAFVGALAAAQMAHGVPLAGSATAGATATGALSGDAALAGNATASANAAAALSLTVSLSGDAIAKVTASADATHGVPLAGAAAAGAQAAGVLSLTTQLTGNANAAASATGELTQGVPLSGAAVAGAQGSASLQGTVPLSGSATAGAQGAGALTLVVSLTAQAVATALATGALSVHVNLTGDAIAQALAGAALTVLADVQLQGSAQAGAAAAAALSVTGADFRPITRIDWRPLRSRSVAFRLN